MQTFFCKLVPPRATFVQDMTAAEAAAMGRHVTYWQTQIERGLRVHALGPVFDPAGAFGVCIMDAEDATAVCALTDADPVIEANIGVRYEIHPMPRGVVHGP